MQRSGECPAHATATGTIAAGANGLRLGAISGTLRCRPQNLEIRIARSMAEIDRQQWNACANPPAPALAEPADASPLPSRFLMFQQNFRKSGSTPSLRTSFCNASKAPARSSARTGWAPMHVLVETAAGELVAAAPTYLKSHSLGEYVFDHGWADAYERAGGRYYPKLQVAVPFTPATGRRLLVRPGAEAASASRSSRRGPARALRQSPRLVDPCHLPDQAGMGGARCGGLPAAHRQAIPFLQPLLRDVRGFSRLARLAQAQDGAARAQGCARPPASRSNG